MSRFLAGLVVVASGLSTLAGCGPSYSPDTYSTNAVQQANKVDAGVIVGFRPVRISAEGTVGGVAGAAAGGAAGAQIGAGPTSTFGAIGGSLIGGIAGVTAEHIIGDANGFEYIVRKANGEMVSVAQKEPKPLPVGQKVLVIAGPQARIVADYTVPFDAPPKPLAKAQSDAGDAGGSKPTASAVTVPLPALLGQSTTQVLIPPEVPGAPPPVIPKLKP